MLRHRVVLLSLFLGILALFLSGPVVAQEQGLESLRQTGKAFRSVAKDVSPAVVFIQVEKTEQGRSMEEFLGPFGDDFFRRFFGEPPQRLPKQRPKRRSMGQGSGFIISPDGYIMTNNHVVGDADKVTVRLLDGREFTAETIGTDPPTDLAVIKIDASDLPFIRLGDSDELEVGDWVLAFGNPFGLSHTLTAGIVSAKGRSGIGINDYENFIQTDAAINPGNSGGPLVDLDGRVVGINTAIFSRSGGYMGIGFAIPVNMAKKIRDQLVQHGRVTRGHLGVYIQDVTQDLAESFDLDEGHGILVSQVIEGSPAEKGGLQRGDVILEINGEPAGKVSEFRNRISLTRPGTDIRLTILREKKKRSLAVTIGKLEGDQETQAPARERDIERLGLSLQELTPDLAEKFGYADADGVLVTKVEPDSPAADAGIERGDLIQEVNRRSVASPQAVREALKLKKGSALLLVRSGAGSRYLALQFDD